jgi:2-acylglycerol O-acyltransferase 2
LFELEADIYVSLYSSSSALPVGRPIEVKQNANPTKAQLEEVQRKYIEELERIWNQWKDAYAANRTKELTIVD